MQTAPKPVRAALYARVSTDSQTSDNQMMELREYVARQGWTAEEYIDHAVSGSKESRPAIDRLMFDARRRRFDAVIVWRLDRFGRSLRHIVTALDELHARGIAFISLGEGIDLSTPAGRLQLHILSALAEFERARIQERIHAGIARARAQGKRLGRKPRIHPKSVAFETVVLNFALSGREAAKRLGVAAETVNRLRREHRRRGDQQSPLQRRSPSR